MNLSTPDKGRPQTDRHPGRRAAAVVLALAVAAVTGAALSIPAEAASDEPVDGCAPLNPMGAATPTGSTSGYTLFVTGDAILANSELEGTLAVGGTATFGDARGNQNLQYPIYHGGVGGNADYDTPEIDGAPNRVLIQRFASANKVVQVKAAGATGTNAEAGARIADQSTPAGYTFGQMYGDGTGTTFYPKSGGNQSPQLESHVQPWAVDDPAASWSLDGDVASYFPADIGAELLGTSIGWHDIAAPAGNDQTITLSGEEPSRLPLASFKGISKFKLEGYSESSFLVITVAPTDVVDGRVVLPSYSFAGKSDQKEGISHILFDLSALQGDVEVTSDNEPVRGSIYAPKANIVFPPESRGGKEFEGQLIAKNLAALQGGKEMHTNLFEGRFPCAQTPVTPIPSASSEAPSPTPTTPAPSEGPTTEAPSPTPTTPAPSEGPTTEVPSEGPTTEAPSPTQTTPAPSEGATAEAPSPTPTATIETATPTATPSSATPIPSEPGTRDTPSPAPSDDPRVPGLPSAGAGASAPTAGAAALALLVAGALLLRRRLTR